MISIYVYDIINKILEKKLKRFFLCSLINLRWPIRMILNTLKIKQLTNFR